MKRFIGIDSGAKGAVAMLSEEGGIEIYPMDYRVLKEALKRWSEDDCICCLEKVGAMPKQGVTSMFNFGIAYGRLLQALEDFDIPYQEITPQRWKKEFGLNSEKVKSIETAHKLFPNANLRPTERCRVDNDGMAEALLMACYAKRKL